MHSDVGLVDRGPTDPHLVSRGETRLPAVQKANLG